jgi:hypothetical protein
MTAEKLTALLENNALLHSTPIIELEVLVQLYPYAQVFKELLFKKELLSTQNDFKQILSTTTIGSIDRRNIFNYVNSIPNDNEAPAEIYKANIISSKNDDEWDSLNQIEEGELEVALSQEFTEINKLIENGVDGTNPFTYLPVTQIQSEFVFLDLDEIINLPFDQNKFTEKKIEIEEDNEPTNQIVKDEIDVDKNSEKQLISLSKYDMYLNYFFENRDSLIFHSTNTEKTVRSSSSLIIEAKVLKITNEININEDQSNFVNWLKRLKNDNYNQLNDPTKRPKEESYEDLEADFANDDLPTKKKKRKMHPIAESSIQPNNEIVTETLAKILTLQGKKDEGIAMYNQLILLFPEKSAYFAQQIENLK